MARPVFNGRIYAHDVLAFIPWDGELWAICVQFRGSVVWAPESCVVYPSHFMTDAPYREPTYLEIREIYDAREAWDRWHIEQRENYAALTLYEHARLNRAKVYAEFDRLHQLLDRVPWDRTWRNEFGARFLSELLYQPEKRKRNPRHLTEEQRLELREALKEWLR